MPRFFLSAYEWLLSAVLLGCDLAYICVTRHWPLVGDAPLFHYIVFLIRHGMAPYRQTVDLNLPGTYAAQWFVIRVFGSGAAAWRVYDFGLLAAVGIAMGAICGRRRWFAALFAASVFALIHGRDGLIQTGQRDLLMAALLLWACALLLAVGRGAGAWASGLAGLLIGAATTVKPIAILLLPVWLLLLAVELGSRRRPWGRHVAAAGAAALVPLAAVAVALFRWHAWAAFLGIMGHLVPLHASMFRLSPWALVFGSVSSVMLGLFLAWLPVYSALRLWRGFQGRVLLFGFLFGVVSFVVQGRGYPYHRYPSEAFLLLLAGLAFAEGMRSKRAWIAGFSVAGLAFGALLIVPRSLAAIDRFDWQHDPYGTALGRELTSLGERALDGKVQCLDQAGGCIAELYKLKIVQSTGFLYDCYLFVSPAGAFEAADQARYRNAFLQTIEKSPPAYFVVTSDECGVQPRDFAYGKLAHWPQLNRLLTSRYSVIRDEKPRGTVAWGGVPEVPYGFRIYARIEPQPATSCARSAGSMLRPESTATALR